MRNRLAALVVVAFGLTLAACDGHPTGVQGSLGETVTPPAPSLSAVAQTSSVKIDFGFGSFVPCAAGGAGEVIVGGGTLHIVDHITFDNAGGLHIKFHFQPQNLVLTGLTTGDTYHGTGVTQGTTVIAPGGLPFTDTFVNNFRMIGEGPNNNLQTHQNTHVTVNENGVLTASADNFSVTCG